MCNRFFPIFSWPRWPISLKRLQVLQIMYMEDYIDSNCFVSKNQFCNIPLNLPLNYASQQYDIMRWMYLHCAQSTLILSDHLLSPILCFQNAILFSWGKNLQKCNLNFDHFINRHTFKKNIASIYNHIYLKITFEKQL